MEQCAERFNECYSISPHRTPSDALRAIPKNETMCLAQAKMTHITHMTNFMGYLINQSPYFFDQRLFQIRVLFFNIIGLIKDSFFHQGLLDEKSKPGLIKDFFFKERPLLHPSSNKILSNQRFLFTRSRSDKSKYSF